MNLDEFISKYIGKKVDFDGAYGAQCVDLFRQYNKEVGGNPHTGSVEGAKEIWTNYNTLDEKKYFKKVRSLKEGDVVVWDGTPTNEYGHVAIFVAKCNSKIIVFEQNGITQKGAELQIRDTNYLGILRFKK